MDAFPCLSFMFERYVRIVLYYVLRDSTLYFTYYFVDTLYKILFWRLHAQVHILLLILSFTVFMMKVYMLVEVVFWKMVSNVLLSAAIKCLRKLIIEFSTTRNE